jgi:cation diffusion facilitator family transporter
MQDHGATGVFDYHDHVYLGSGHEKNERKTWAVIVLCTVMMAVEIVGGQLYGSLALVADGLHMSTHAGAMLIAALAYTYARRHASDARFVFGTGKLGDLAGFTSAIVLAMISVLIGYEAVTRFLAPVPIYFGEAIPIAIVGLLVNIASAWLLSGHDHGHAHAGPGSAHDHEHDDHVHDEPAHAQAHDHPHAHIHDHDHDHDHVRDRDHNRDHDHDRDHGHAHGHAPEEGAHAPISSALRDNNIRSAYVHVIADAAVSVLAIVGLLLARGFHWLWMDPLAGIIGALVIASWSYRLLRDTGGILLDMNPDHAMANRLRQAIERDGDRLVDFHLWRLGPGHLGAVVCVVTAEARDCAFYRERLKGFKALSHVTVEVINRSVRVAR